MYVVVDIENEWAFGPYETYEEAFARRIEIARKNELDSTRDFEIFSLSA